MRRFQTTMLAVLLLTVCPGSVFAHAIGVSCKIRGDQVEVEAYYDDDSPAKKARVVVLNAEEYFVASGSTDEKGRWVFATPAPGVYKVLVDAGAGHRAKTTLTVPGLVSEPAPLEAPSTEANPERAEFTQVPWLNVLIGMAVIGGGFGVFLMARKKWLNQ